MRPREGIMFWAVLLSAAAMLTFCFAATCRGERPSHRPGPALQPGMNPPALPHYAPPHFLQPRGYYHAPPPYYYHPAPYDYYGPPGLQWYPPPLPYTPYRPYRHGFNLDVRLFF